MDKGFDPYPFILLNLILSCLAAIQAPIIMMSQNRKEEIDRSRSENDYIINLKAETQIRNMDEKINILVIEQMKKMFKLQEGQLELLNEIKKIVKKQVYIPDYKTMQDIIKNTREYALSELKKYGTPKEECRKLSYEK